MYTKILISALGILLIFRIISFLNKNLSLSKKTKHYTGFILPVIELVIWLVFLIWCMHLIYQDGDYTTLIIIGVFIVFLIAPAGFLVRDFVHGMLLKIQRKIEIDTRIEIGELQGKIVKTDYFTFDIQTSVGEIKTIPYNKIKSEIISKNAANINLDKLLISFNIHSDNDVSQLLPKLKKTLVNAPWVATSQEPIISNITKVNEGYNIDTIFYVIKKEHADKIKEYVRKNFTEKLKY